MSDSIFDVSTFPNADTGIVPVIFAPGIAVILVPAVAGNVAGNDTVAFDISNVAPAGTLTVLPVVTVIVVPDSVSNSFTFSLLI